MKPLFRLLVRNTGDKEEELGLIEPACPGGLTQCLQDDRQPAFSQAQEPLHTFLAGFLCPRGPGKKETQICVRNQFLHSALPVLLNAPWLKE